LNTSPQYLTARNLTGNLQIFDPIAGSINEDYSTVPDIAGKFAANGAFHSSDEFFVTGGSNKKLFLFIGSPPPPIPPPCTLTSQVEISPGNCADCLAESDFTTNLAQCQGDANVKFFDWSVNIKSSS
jgi:hypothetical protein